MADQKWAPYGFLGYIISFNAVGGTHYTDLATLNFFNYANVQKSRDNFYIAHDFWVTQSMS